MSDMRHKMGHMTELIQEAGTTAGPAIPAWTLGWRLQRALAHAGITTEQMADELGIGRSTVSRWLNDRNVPKAYAVKQWALRTAVDADWLLNGEAPRPGGPGRGAEGCATMDSNHEPAGMQQLPSIAAFRERRTHHLPTAA